MRRLFPIATVMLPVAFLYWLGAFEFLERTRIDAGFRLTARAAHAEVVLVEIDTKSLHALGVWPWARGYHATVLERLVDAGARRVGFDIEFSSRSDSEEDSQLVQALAAVHGKAVLPVFRQWQEVGPDELHLTIAEPLPEFARHATLASINVRPESDGLVRKYSNRVSFQHRIVPGFASALAGDPRPDLDSFYIDYGIASRSIPRLSYVDVLTGRFDHGVVRDKAVIIGSTAVELGDQIAVPISAALPGPLVQALAFESLRQERTLQRANRSATLALALLLALLLAPLYGRFSWRSGLLLAVGSCALFLVGSGLVEQRLPVLLDVMPWVFASLGLHAFATLRQIDQQALGLLLQRRTIRHTETLMRHVVQSSFDAIVTLGAEGRIETFNCAAELMFGYSQAEAVERRLSDLVSRAGDDPPASLLAQAVGGLVEARAHTRDGRCLPIELVVTRIEGEDDSKLVAVIRDITERQAHQEELQHRATHDPLTDLPNRTLLVERIQRAIAEAQRREQSLAVMLLDLDRFKEINDALGHAVGDVLLGAVAQRLADPLEPGQTLSRLGGDEFAVLLPRATADAARAVAWKLVEALKQPFCVEGLYLQVETSLGVTLYPEHGADAESLVQRADVAMYVAKEAKTGVVVYGPEHDCDHMRQLTIKGELRHAIEGGQLHLVYQPKVHHATDRVVGCEALLRWQHPEHGFIPPDEFASMAEHSGLIRPLTQWVLETALLQASRWRREGMPLEMSVNVSARNLLEEDLPDRLQRMLLQHELKPRYLTLEITECVIMDDPERALANMHRLRDLGVRISVDDFGTGYSSLAYLAQLPANELKIDKSFVMQLDTDTSNETIVLSTIELAHKMGMRVVAEGVETAKAWELLKQAGCDIGQGYYFSRPIPPDELSAFVAASAGAAATVVPSGAAATSAPPV